MIGMVDLSFKKGTGINGIVEEYVAKGNISVGGFVKYLNEYYTKDTKLADGQSNIAIKAVALNDTKVFVVFSCGSSNNMYAVICNISNTITVGTTIALNTNNDAGNKGLSAIALNENKMFIVFRKNTEYSNLYAIICTIEENTIVCSSSVLLTTNATNGLNTTCAVALNENKVCVVYSNNSSNFMYAVICTINGTDIIVGQNAQISNVANSSASLSILLLSENTVFISHSYNGNHIYAIVCTISGTNITVGTDTPINTNSGSAYEASSSVKLSENKVLVTCCYGRNGRYLAGRVCVINGTTITCGALTQLSTTEYSSYAISAVALNANTVLIAHSTGSGTTNNKLYGMMCAIKENTITVKSDIKLSEDTMSGYIISVILIGNKIFIGHSTTGYALYGTVSMLQRLVQSATQSNKIYRRSPKQSYRGTSRQGRKTNLFRGGKLKCF